MYFRRKLPFSCQTPTGMRNRTDNKKCTRTLLTLGALPETAILWSFKRTLEWALVGIERGHIFIITQAEFRGIIG
jgi:hypothetical protein